MPGQNLSLIHKIHEPQQKPSQSPPLLLMLHGIGSNEDDLLGLAPYLDHRFFIVSARAPIIMGPGGYAWFNIEFTPREMIPNLIEAEHSRVTLLKFIDELVEHYRVDPKAVYLMGFSQGAMMSLNVCLTHAEKIAGVVAMSGRLPTRAQNNMAQASAVKGMHIFMSHGEYDPLIPVEFSRAARLQLETLLVDLTYREYAMGHEVSMESLRDIGHWLTSNLDHKSPSA